MFNFIERSERMPVGVLATALGAATLSNVYALFGFSMLRHIFMWMGAFVFLLGTIKFTVHRKVFFKEYGNTILASLYGTYSMLAMILGSYVLPYNNVLGRGLWSFGITVHVMLILIFTYINVIKKFDVNKFAPSWFVTYNGIMVSIVVGGAIDAPLVKKIILYYGIGVFFIIIPFMVRRLIVKPLPDAIYHTKAVLLAPSSLCVICYLSIVKVPNPYMISLLYGIVFATLLLLLTKIPKFFSFEFHPGFAGTTFPMAIGTVASFKMADFLGMVGLIDLSNIIRNVAGIQMFITTGIIIFVYFNFLRKAARCNPLKK